MSHDFHQGHPRFSPDQVLKDGCAECAERSTNLGLAIPAMDPATFARAWERAARFGPAGIDGVPDVAGAEVPLLRALWGVQLQFERRGIPLGEIPSGVTA